MNALKILTGINILFMLMACLRVWLPITFRYFAWFNGYYSILLYIVLSCIAVFQLLSRGIIAPSIDDVETIIYTDDDVERTKRQLIFHAFSFVVYQAFILWLFL